MAEHDYTVPLDKCPRCVELRSLVHDVNLPPSQCPACTELGRERSMKKSRATPIPGIDLGIVCVSANTAHATLPIGPNHAGDLDGGWVPAAPAKTPNEGMADAKRAAYAAIEQRRATQRAIVDSWNSVIAEINNRNRSSGGW